MWQVLPSGPLRRLRRLKRGERVVCILVLECIGCGNCCHVHEWYGSLYMHMPTCNGCMLTNCTPSLVDIQASSVLES